MQRPASCAAPAGVIKTRNHGAVAKRLCRGLQSLGGRFDSAPRLQDSVLQGRHKFGKSPCTHQTAPDFISSYPHILTRECGLDLSPYWYFDHSRRMRPELAPISAL